MTRGAGERPPTPIDPIWRAHAPSPGEGIDALHQSRLIRFAVAVGIGVACWRGLWGVGVGG